MIAWGECVVRHTVLLLEARWEPVLDAVRFYFPKPAPYLSYNGDEQSERIRGLSEGLRKASSDEERKRIVLELRAAISERLDTYRSLIDESANLYLGKDAQVLTRDSTHKACDRTEPLVGGKLDCPLG